jgi:hypothetical protein
MEGYSRFADSPSTVSRQPRAENPTSGDDPSRSLPRSCALWSDICSGMAYLSGSAWIGSPPDHLPRRSRGPRPRIPLPQSAGMKSSSALAAESKTDQSALPKPTSPSAGVIGDAADKTRQIRKTTYRIWPCLWPRPPADPRGRRRSGSRYCRSGFHAELAGRQESQPAPLLRPVGRPLFLSEGYDTQLHHRSSQFPARSQGI